MDTNPTNALDNALDIFARLTVLEIVAGVPRNTWTQLPSWLGLQAARKALPTVHAGWFAPVSTVLRAIRRAASTVLDDMIADEVVQDVLGGLTRTGGILAYVANKHREHILNKRGPSCICGDLSQHTFQRATNVGRQPTTFPVNPFAQHAVSLVDVVDEDALSAWAAVVIDAKFSSKQSALLVARLWLASGCEATATDIARQLGMTSPVYPARVIRQARAVLRAAVLGMDSFVSDVEAAAASTNILRGTVAA